MFILADRRTQTDFFSVEAMSKGDAFIGMDDGMEEVNEKKKEQNMGNLVQKGIYF